MVKREGVKPCYSILENITLVVRGLDISAVISVKLITLLLEVYLSAMATSLMTALGVSLTVKPGKVEGGSSTINFCVINTKNPNKEGMAMTFDQMKKEYTLRYSSDKEFADLLNLFKKADNLSQNAKKEFVVAFNFDFALDGTMYLGGKKTATIKFPNLVAEAPLVGIHIETR